MRQWWLGREVPMAGVAGVKVAPEFRGRGVGRALMTELTELMVSRGYPLSALYAATMPIYRQQGWEMAGARYTAKFPVRSLRGLDQPGVGTEIRRAGPDDAAAVIDVLGSVHALARDCGPVTFTELVVRDWLADQDSFAYLAPDGFLRYNWHSGNEDLHVDKLVAGSEQTIRALISVLASHSSIASTVRAHVSPADQLWWLLREQDGDIAERYAWMLRILDAPAAIAARGFPPVDVEVPLRLTDGFWQLSVRSGEKAQLARTASAHLPDTVLGLGARGLAALYAGTPVATLRRAGLAAGGTPDADALLDAAFAASAFMLDDF
jgi:predicted acetyltransferase